MNKAYTKEEWLALTPEQKQEYYDARRPIINEVLDLVNKTSEKKYCINNYLVLCWRDENNEPHGPITWVEFIRDNLNVLMSSQFKKSALEWLEKYPTPEAERPPRTNWSVEEFIANHADLLTPPKRGI